MRRPAPLPVGLLLLARRQEGLLSARQCDDAGVPQSRRRSVRHAGLLLPVARGVHDAGPALDMDGGREAWTGRHPDDHGRRRAAWHALLSVAPGRGAATGMCALALLGVEGLPRRVRPEVALLDGSHRRPPGAVRVRSVEPGPVRRVGGAPVVAPTTALAQAVCELDREHAVAVLDSAVHQGLVAVEHLDEVRRTVHGRRGSRRTASWWDLVDGRAQSPWETRARLQCRDAGVPAHDLQVPVRDASGRVVARGDLGWWLAEGRWLIAEIDGAGPHGTPEALYRDRTRQNDIVAAGALVLRFTVPDVRSGAVARTVARHLHGPSSGTALSRDRTGRPHGHA